MQIATQGIQMELGGAAILKGIDIGAHPGQFIGVIGPNGSGKSTLLKCIYRVLKPSGGAVMLDGKPLSAWSYKESARRVAVVAQHHHVAFDFTVIDMVLLGRSPHKKALDRDNAEDLRIAREALERVDMAGFERRSFATLSGGEQQRVILAQALAQQTPCLVLDEPTNHLDIKYQLQLMDIVKRLDVTVLSAIHDLNIAALYCDYLYVMKDGMIVCQGPVRQVLTPQLIRQVYDVQAQVMEDGKGYLHILYNPLWQGEDGGAR